MECISTIQTASVIKQPDAVERPLTLVEKLEQEIESLENSFEQFAIVDDEITMVHIATIAGLKIAIKIVKQNSEWVRCDERMPEDEQEVLWWNEAYQCLVIGEWRENRELVFYHNGDYADVSEFFYWQCLPKPPSEVQDD